MKMQNVIKLYSVICVICVIWVVLLISLLLFQDKFTTVKTSDWVFVFLGILSVIFITNSKNSISKSNFIRLISVVLIIAILTDMLIWIPNMKYGTPYAEILKNVSLLTTAGLSLFSLIAWIMIKHSE